MNDCLTKRIRLDRESEASHDLNRLLDEPGCEGGKVSGYENSFLDFTAREARAGLGDASQQRLVVPLRGESGERAVLLPPWRVLRASVVLSTRWGADRRKE